MSLSAIRWEYPGAVFLCHALNKTGVYKVPLVGRDGTKANALAVCHKETSEAFIDSNLNNFKVDDNIVSVDETTFFFQRDLRTGKLVSLPNLIATGDKTPFLPDQVAKSIPFSSAKLPEILNHFSLKPQTRDANTICETIRGCERAAINGEQKFCATSLESFIDLSISKLGKQIQLLSIEFSKETKNPLFTIARGMQNMGEHELVCHKMEYPGAVFLCHALNKTGVYKVPLVGRDGTKANALAVCHKDTSGWILEPKAYGISDSQSEAWNRPHLPLPFQRYPRLGSQLNSKMTSQLSEN
ncbi:dehydration-responsive protein RD22-like [Gossypium australe]|uniref:Dehydration-responsive protein RD22-like n=1 Tax=Gossypium australe TaxID=47621 RepID=A0A5B6VQL6_9ROSI|nr:dehydration-responsive protein RD22-like [Gossypium australe]